MILFFVGLIVGALSIYLTYRLKKKRFSQLGQLILHRAELEAEKKESALSLRLKEREFQEEKRLKELEESLVRKIEKEREKHRKKEEKLEASWSLFVRKLADVEKKKEWLLEKERELQCDEGKLSENKIELKETLSRIADLSLDEAKKELFQHLERELGAEIGAYIAKKRDAFESEAEAEAKRLLALTLNRLSSKAGCEMALTTISLPSDEMKGRIIGREGKNIRAFEEKAGVNLIIDETPKSVIISSYDPYRKAIAHAALLELIQDGRIHPSRIEEALETAEERVNKKIREEGERAIQKVKILPPHPSLTSHLGQLSLRYSLGQNVLEHSIEVAQMMGLMAAELSCDVELAKRIGLFHDIGKGVSDDPDNSHALCGFKLALKYGERNEVANGIGAHHGEIPVESIEAALLSTADTLSSGRLGARSEGVEHLFHRLQKLETLALSFPGVEKAYAFSQGKEIRIIAEPDLVCEEELTLLARKIAKQIEQEISFSGKIKVTVIREKKATEYAI